MGAAAVVVMRARAPAPVASGLQALSGPAAVHLTDDVRLTYEGEGWVSGTERDLLLTWDVGQLTVQVEPDQGVELQVATPEGSVWITGTAFTINRDKVQGTDVEVLRGQVKVQCIRGEEVFLDPGQQHHCQPIDPDMLLKQAIGLVRDQADPQQILGVADLGLQECRQGCGDSQAGLMRYRIQALYALERYDEALLAIQAYRELAPATSDPRIDRLEQAIQRKQAQDVP